MSKEFHKLAHDTANREPDNPETLVSLRKLLESKDAAVRAKLPAKTTKETVQEAAEEGFRS